MSVVVSGAMRIEIREYHDGRNGATRYGFGSGRKKVRRMAVDEAREEARRRLSEGKAGWIDRSQIPPAQLAEFMAWQARRRPKASVADVVRDFLVDKQRAQDQRELSEKHVSDLRGTLEPLARDFRGPIDEVAEDRRKVEKWLNDRGTGPRRFNNMRAHLIALLRYARSHRFIDSSATACEAIARRKALPKKETYSPEEMAALLRVVPIEWLPAIVLGGFCGIRPEEICPDSKSAKTPLQWQDFLWHKKTIRLSEETVKASRGSGRVRWVPIGETALAWIGLWRNAKGPTVPRMKMSDMTARWGRKAGIRWKSDGLRHSYASYRLALIHNIGQLSEEMGNSSDMIRRHYLDAKHHDDAEEYFSLTPQKVGREDLGKVTIAA